MKRQMTFAGAGLAALAASAIAVTPGMAAAKVKDNGAKINIVGGMVFHAGHSVGDNQRFTGTTTVKKGGTIKVVNRAKTEDPHSVSFVKKADLPKSFAGMENPAIGALFGAHGFPPAGEGGPEGPPPAPANPVVNAGAAGFDTVGDSFFFVGKRYSIPVARTAKKGTYSYLCLIHPWMQGTVRVK